MKTRKSEKVEPAQIQPGIFSTKLAAAYCSIHPKTLLALSRRYKIPFIQFGTHSKHFRREVLDELGRSLEIRSQADLLRRLDGRRR